MRVLRWRLFTVWGYLRQDKLCALAWGRYNHIVEDCETAWNWLVADLARITLIGTLERACVGL